MSQDKLIGLMPAAGKGTRLGWPFPKELWPVVRDGELLPIGRATIDNFVSAAIRHIVVITNGNKPELMRYLGSGSQFDVCFSYACQEEARLKGPSSGLSEAIDCSYHLIRGKIVAFGMPDTLVEPQACYAPLLEKVHRGADLVLGLFSTDTPKKYGMVQMDRVGRVHRIVDKPEITNLQLMWGILAWSPAFTEHLHEVMQCTLTDFAGIMNSAIERGLCVRGMCVENGDYFDLASCEDALQLPTILARQHQAARVTLPHTRLPVEIP